MDELLPGSIETFGFPVSLAFSKNGKVFLSERITGRLWQIDHGNNRLIKTFPTVPLIGHHETGLLGIELDPNFDTNGYIYCYYTEGTSYKNFKNKIIKIHESGNNETIVLDNIPAGLIHNGGIIKFGPDRNLYIGVGENNNPPEQAQDINKLGGKILRIKHDGSIPEDNPFNNSPVYSYGHRNPFGLAFHPHTGKLYISDVGPDKNDEINIIKKGGNYGWPVTTGISDNTNFINPIKAYTPVITPTQNVFVEQDLYFGSFNEGTVHKLTFSGENFDKVESDEIVYKGTPFGVTGVFYGSDNQFYVTTPNNIICFKPQTINQK